MITINHDDQTNFDTLKTRGYNPILTVHNTYLNIMILTSRKPCPRQIFQIFLKRPGRTDSIITNYEELEQQLLVTELGQQDVRVPSRLSRAHFLPSSSSYIPRDFHGSKHTVLVALLSMIIKFGWVNWQTKNGRDARPLGSSYRVFSPSPFYVLSKLQTHYRLLLYCTW